MLKQQLTAFEALESLVIAYEAAGEALPKPTVIEVV
jgi:hypothetical protein